MPVGGGLQRVAVAANQSDPIPGVKEGLGRRRANAAPGTRDDDGFCHVSGPFRGEIIKAGDGGVYAARRQCLASAAAFFYLLGRS